MNMDTPDTPSNVAPPAQARPTEGKAEGAVKPNGPVAAVMLATGIGSVVLGLLTTLAAASEGVKDFLRLDDGVGPLSGKTTFAAVAFLIVWGGLHAALRERDFAWRPVIAATVVLLAIALVLTFPPFFEAFESE
jgi:hypothetical protein